MDRSKQTATKYLKDEKTRKAIIGKMFQRLNKVSKNFYEVEQAKSKIEHREPIIVGFFILLYAKLIMLKLYYILVDSFFDVDKLGELEMDRVSLFLALAHEILYGCIRPAKRQESEASRQQDCNDYFQADATQNFFPRTCCSKHKKKDKREPGLFKEDLRYTELICFCRQMLQICFNK